MSQPYEKVKMSRKDMIINNFIGGISWTFGATIGIAVIITILTFISKNINLVPFVGNFIAEVIQFIAQKYPQLIQ
ncbi:MAG TPA: DUF5665 domain-containing protein [Patescibacteria group bacterium]|nr:DUF5665 domain-containing protein [Patescibacteria group bacterium]